MMLSRPRPRPSAPDRPYSPESGEILARRLVAGGFRVRSQPRPGRLQLAVKEVTGGWSELTMIPSGQLRWHFEPRTGTAVSADGLAQTILRILSPASAAVLDADCYPGYPFKGAVGRHLQQLGLHVALLVSEDWESFEATTEIEVTCIASPQLGAVRLADDAVLDWTCNYHYAFGGDPARYADTLAALLRTALY